jgi:hypothetical protein
MFRRYGQRTERVIVVSAVTDTPFLAPSESPTTSPIAETDVVEIDPVHEATMAIWRSRGWTYKNKNGEEVPDDEAAKGFVYSFFRDHVVVNSDGDIVDDGVTDADLYAKTFPGTPGATSYSVDADQFEAYKSVSRKIWAYAATRVGSVCQERAEMEGLDLVMCEKKVYRASRDISTGTGAPKQVSVRFFTSNGDLIYQLSALPATAKLVKAAEDTAKHLRMNVTRHPELSSRIAKSAKLALNQSSASLGEITSGKLATPAAGDDDN